MLTRRNLASMTALLAIAGCSSSGGLPPVSLQQMKAYATALIDALAAAADVYITQPGAKNIPLVVEISNNLQDLKAAINAVEAEVDARGIALQIIQFAQQLSPIVLPFLGPAGPLVPVALAVLQAFVLALPPPPQAPETPPPALHPVAVPAKSPN